MIRARRWIAILGLMLASAPALVAGAADEPATSTAARAAPAGTPSAPSAATSSWAYDLAGELMSPFCPGRTLASCPSPQAGELIQWIATQEAAGVSRDEVIAILVERHGEEILGAPPAKGITLWAYVFPVLGFVAFGGIAAVVLSRIVGGKDGAASGQAAAPAASGSTSVSTSSPASASTSVSSSSASRADARTPAADELARIVDAELAERA
ncbi:MAG: cytochrome c-type biogenesis protein CcmH [Deltaproteobacteria bacterium]|nr:cytochrome c-type biogenesis protein CcmH [Deltaproteobacteria bacterium]